MIIPRNWEPIQHQRYPEQTADQAIPTATDARFKAAAFFLVVCWLTTVFSLRHSIKHYCPRNRGILNRAAGFVRYTPLRFMLIIPLAAVIPVYQALVAWHFAWSPLNADGLEAAIYPGAFTPALLIVFIQGFFGILLPNEDLELQRQRRIRGQELDRELGIVHKPAWWRRVNGEYISANESMRDRLARNVREIHGNKPTPSHPEAADSPGLGGNGSVEMAPVSPSPLSSPTVPRPVAQQYRRREDITMDAPPPPPYRPEGDRGAVTNRQAPNDARSISGDSTNRPPQQIRSMLDV